MSGSVGRERCEVAVVGAGPYGLAVAAHLKAANIDTLVFGEAMSFWRRHMPQGMKLRSPWHATHIPDPAGMLSMDVYDKERRLARTYPVPLEEFVQYGEWFQRHAVPDLDQRKVRDIDRSSRGFRLELANGDTVHARRVVMAMGLANQEYRPPEFRGLPAALVSHTCEHDNLQKFHGQRVAVIGRGQSACESAVLLHESGADVDLICRGPIHWLGGPGTDQRKTVRERAHELLTPRSAVGPFPLNWLAEYPAVVHLLPHDVRAWFNTRSLRAGAAGWLLPRFTGGRVNAGRKLMGASATRDRITLHLDNGSAEFDHVLLATGYRIDVSRLGILAPNVLRPLNCVEGSPRLSVGLESTIKGLHFVGASAVRSFGPLMRFIAGASFAARHVTRAIAGQARFERLSANLELRSVFSDQSKRSFDLLR